MRRLCSPGVNGGCPSFPACNSAHSADSAGADPRCRHQCRSGHTTTLTLSLRQLPKYNYGRGSLRSSRGTIARRGPPGKAGGYPVHLIPKRTVDNWVVGETGIDLALDLSSSSAEALKNLSARRFSKQWVVSATYQKQWSEGRLRSRPVARKELLNVLVVVPTRLQDFVRRNSSKCAAGRAASAFYRCVVYAESPVGEHVVELKFRIDSFDAVHPKRYEAIERGCPRLQNSLNAVLKVTRARECDCAKEIRVFDFAFQLCNSQASQSALRMPHNEPLLAEVRDCRVRRRYRVHNISCVAQHVEVRVPALRAQPGIVGRDHGIAQHHVFVESLPVVEQRLHEGRRTIVRHSAGAMRPCQQRPTVLRRLTVWNQDNAGCECVCIVSSSGVIQNACSRGPRR